MYRTLFVAMVVVLGTALPSQADSNTWDIDSKHSSAQFSIRHMMISNVKGVFGKISGTVNYDGKNLSKAGVDAAIDTSTIDTREEGRDKHLKSPDFLDVAKFPTMSFKSKKVQPGKGGKFKLIGELTLHGVTKEVTLNVDALSPEIKDSRGNVKIGTTASTKINRKDFGITYGGLLDNGGAVIGDEVSINIDLEMAKRQSDTAGSVQPAKPTSSATKN